MRDKIKPNPDFCLERASTCSLAIKHIYSWANAMFEFNKVYL